MKKLFKAKINQGLARRQAGMTYVELIVVLSIFAALSAVAMFNYGEFQAKVDIKNLGSDIALKIVEAQKSALSGKLTTQAFASRPSYGVYFNITTPGVDDKHFTYFANLDDSDFYDDSDLILDQPTITKNNFISGLKCGVDPIQTLSIVFRRPDSRALMTCVSDVEITISSPGTNPATARIIVSPSGRIQVN